MNNEVLTILIPALSAVAVAAIEAVAAKERKKQGEWIKQSEERVKVRMEESRLSMQMMDATLKLSVVTANALTGGHNNGNVAKAKEAAAKAQDEYEDFLREAVVKEIYTK